VKVQQNSTYPDHQLPGSAWPFG